MNNKDKANLIEKLKLASSDKITNGIDFLYEGKNFSIKWKDLIELINTIHVKVETVENPVKEAE